MGVHFLLLFNRQKGCPLAINGMLNDGLRASPAHIPSPLRSLADTVAPCSDRFGKQAAYGWPKNCPLT